MTLAASASRTYTATDLVALLSAALGAAQAAAVVEGALRRSGVSSASAFGAEEARTVLADVASQSGLVGITGRIALSRLHLGSVTPGAPTPTRSRRPIAVVAKLLAHALGEERAASVVAEAAAKLAVGASGQVDLREALAILESLASTSGVTSAAARFAKSRIHLSW